MLFSRSIRKFLFASLLAALIMPANVKSDFGDVATISVLASGGWGLYKLGAKVYDLYEKYGKKDTRNEEKNKENSFFQNTSDLPWAHVKERYYQYLEAKPWGAVAKKYIKSLKEEEQAFLEEFFTIARISQKDFDYYKQQWRQHFVDQYAKADEIFSPRIDNKYSKLFKHNFESIGISPCNLVFREYHGQREPFAAAAFNTIYINPKKITRCKDIEVAVVAFHELMHVMHEDRLNTLSMQYLMHNQLKDFAIKYQAFKERRADILALLLNPKLAKHTATWYSHDQVVSEYSQRLYSEMIESQTSKLA